MMESPLKLYPLEQIGHHGKLSHDPISISVCHGKVIDWSDPLNLYYSLIASADERNRPLVNNRRRKDYSHQLFVAADKKDIPGMRASVVLFPEMVPEPEQVLACPNELFRQAARYMTEAIG